MKKLILSFLATSMFFIGARAQTNIANYTFAKSIGSYVALSSPTVLGTATAATGATLSLDGTNYRVAFPGGFTFTFGGVAQTDININSNGYIGFGTAIWTGNTTSPFANNPAGGTTNGIISAFARDLNAVYNTTTSVIGDISYQLVGSAPDRELVVQFKNFKPYSGVADARLLNFQIHLFESTHTTSPNAINIVFGNCNTGDATVTDAKTGIRGNSLTYSTNVNSLMISDVPAGTTCDWNNVVTAFANTSSLNYSSANTNISIPNGLTFSWAPPAIALAPVRTFSAVTGITASAATIAWTAPTGATQYNVQYRLPGTCAWTTFTGSPVSTNSVTLTGLTPYTIYQVRVQSLAGTNSSIYSHIPDLAGTGNGYTAGGTFTTQATCPVPTALNTSTILPTSANFTWTAGGTETAWDVYYGASPLTPPTATTVPTATTALNSYSATGLTPVTNYSVYVRANCGAGDLSFWTAVKTFTTAALTSDLQTNLLQAPSTNASGCYASSIPVVIQIRNAGSSALDFSTNNATILTSITGPNPQSFTTSVNTGTLAAGAIQNVTVTSTYNMSTAGVYTFNASSTLASPDANTSNDAMAAVTKTTTVGTPLPYSQDFAAGTTPTGWTNTSSWSFATNHGLTNNGIYYNLWTSAASASFNLLRLGTISSSNVLSFDYRILNYNVTYPGTQVPPTGNWGNLKIQVSTDCGATFTDIGTIDNTTHTITTQAWTNKIYSLAAFAGQDVIIKVLATWATGDYYIDMDNFNVASCLPPTGLNNTSIASTSANFTWTPGGAESAWDIYYGAQPLTAPTASTAPTATSSVASYSVTGLTQLSPYAVYVRANCGAGDLSAWTAVKNFTTIAACPASSNLTISAITPTSAVATWTAGGTETSWLISYSAPSTTAIVSGSPSYTLSGLNPTSTYSVQVKGICAVGDSSTFTANQIFTTPCLPPNITGTTPNIRCGVGTTTLGATADAGAILNWYSASTGGLSLGTGNAFTTPTISSTTNFYVSAGNVASGSKSLGVGGSTGTAAAYDFANGTYGGMKTQYLYTASELLATGLTAGNINSLAFEFTGAGAVLNGFEVQMGTTSFTTFPTPVNILGGLTLVKPASSFTPVVGVNTLNLSTPYNWDGVSNIIISLSWSNNNTSNTSSTIKYDVTANYASQSYRKDSETALNMAAFTGTLGSGTNSFSRTLDRPKITLSGNIICESARTAVTASVTLPDGVVASTSASTLCVGATSTATLTATQTGTTNAYSFTWDATPVTGSGMPTSVSGTITSVTPTAPGTYTYAVTATDGVCTTVSSVAVTLNNVPAVVATATPSTLCSGNSTTLFLGSANAVTPFIGNTSGTTISTTGTPYRTGTTVGNETRSQYLILGSELISAGLGAGNLQSLSFIVSTAAPTGVMTNFSIGMAQTTATALTTTFLTPSFTNVYSVASYTPVTGTNTHAFSTPFNWDGVSNVIINVCGKLGTGGGGTSLVTSTTPGGIIATVANSAGTGCTNATGTTLTNQRPRFIIGGNSAVNFTNISWSNGSVVGTTNPLTHTVTSSATYTVNADANGCPVSTTVNVISIPLPSTPIASDNTQCGVGVPTASVSGGTSYNWYASPTSTTVLQAGSSSNFTTAISSTTTWYVSSFGGTCESPRVALTQSVTVPDAITASSSATNLCVGGANTITLTATNTGTTNVYSYTWNASPASGSGIPTTIAGATVNVTPTLAGVYTYSVLGTDGVCNAVSTVTVVLNSLPSINAMATPTAICSGESVNLNAQSINAAAGTATVGAQTTTGSTGSPYRQGAATDNKAQYLFTAAELNAAGIYQGNITEIRFNATAAGSGTMDNFMIKVGSTTATSLSTTYNTPPALVYGPYSYSVTLGQNIHTFDTPFNWDGVSSVVIEICHDIVVPTGSSSTISMQAATNRVIYSTVAGACNLTTGTNATSRPVIGFGAQVGTNVTSSMNFVWNPGAINSNTATVNPINTGSVAATQVYSVTVTNTTTTCSNTSTVDVLVNPIPTSPIVTDNTQCGIGVPTASVSGNTSYKWYATPTSTTVLQAGSAANYTTSISSTTTWYVSSFSGFCESPRVAVTQTVTTPPVLTLNAPAAICSDAGIGTFSITSTVADYSSYVWTPTTNLYTDAAATIAYTGGNSQIVYVKSTTAGVVTVSVNATSSVTGCANIANTSITVNSTPSSVTVTPVSSTLCAGASQTLTVNGGIVASSLTIGTQANQNTNTTYPAPYSAYFGGQRMQTLILASELSAAGFINGSNINSMELPVVSRGSNWGGSITSLQSFQIKIGATASTSLSAFQAGLSNVVNSTNYTPVVGSNVHTFTTPFVWDGVSNVIIETTFSNNFTGGTNDGIVQYNSPTAFQSTILYRADGVTAATAETATTVNSSFSVRPDLKLNGALVTNYSWNPSTNLSPSTGSVVVATPTASTAYTVTATIGSCSSQGIANITVNPNPTITVVASNTAICSGASATFTASGATNYTWTPVGGTAATAVVTPTANATYTVTGESLGCSATKTVALIVNATPTVSAVSSSSVICSGGSSTATLTATSTTPNYSWTPTGGTAATEVVTPTGNTTYTVTSDNAGCIGTATVAVNVNTTPTLTLASSTASMCSGGTATLTAAGATNYTWTPSGVFTSTAVVTPSATTIYTVTGESAGCSATSTLNLDVTQTPTVTASASPTAICLGNSAALTAVSSTPNYTWAPAGGTADIAIVSPSVSTVYTVTSTNGACVGTATVNLDVLTAPVLTVSPSSSTVCTASSTTLTASGADTYTWSAAGGNAASAVFTPTALTTYTVEGSNACGTGSTSATIDVTTPLTISATTSSTMLCSGETATLTATGATSFNWVNGGQTTAIIAVTPTTTTIYTVTSTNACGLATATVTQNVSPCAGIQELELSNISVYPNPSTGIVNFDISAELAGNVSLEMYDAIGKLVVKENLTKEHTVLNLSKLEEGIYIFKMIKNNGDVKIGRFVKHN